MMKKMVLAVLLIAAGFAVIAYGMISLKKMESRNAIIEAIKTDKPTETLPRLESGGDAARLKIMTSFVQLQSGDLQKAEETLSRVVINTDTSIYWRVRALYNLANLQVLKGVKNQDQSAFKNAVYYYQESLRLDPSFWPSKYNLERLIQEMAGKKQQQGEEEESQQNGKQQKQEDSKPNINPPNSGMP